MIAAGAALTGLCSVAAARARPGRVAGFALGLAADALYGLLGGLPKARLPAPRGVIAEDPAQEFLASPAGR